MSRFVYVVLDGVGVGALPDAADYGDAGANTLGNLAELVDLRLPTMESLGLGCILPLRGVPPAERPLALPGRLTERSAGKDTTAGHWEHMGVLTTHPFPTYPEGFPEEVLEPFRARIGREVLGNKPASGTDIIAELGEEHLRTGRPIVYTSADSVFQIAAHLEVVPLPELYRWCEVARDLLRGPHAVARVIARPFTGTPGGFGRTADRKDFSLAPPSPTYLDLLADRGVPVLGVGKISQIFAGRGVTEEHKVGSNDENLQFLSTVLAEGRPGVIMTNLVDFDMAWGHRNDVDGFAAGLEAFDAALPGLLAQLGPDDRLLITADHGVDPTTVSTDHSREYVPLLLYPRPGGSPTGCYQGTMTDTGATLFAHFFPDEEPPLGGVALQDGAAAKRWTSCPRRTPGRVASADADRAARTLQERFGPPPYVAVVLGSGFDQLVDDLEPLGDLAEDEVPGWPPPRVRGHAGRVGVYARMEIRLAVLRGRAHGYEGYDRSELQLPVRTLARWGVRRVLLTAAVGALTQDLAVGQAILVERVLDVQAASAGRAPGWRTATTPALLHRMASLELAFGHYAAVPGPQYETAAEKELLRHLRAHVVGMSLAAEVEAATEEALDIVVVAVVTNEAAAPAPAGVGPIGGSAHDEVVAVADSAVPRVLVALDALLTGD